MIVVNLRECSSIRLLAIVDNYSRESLALQVGFRLGGNDVAQALNRLIAEWSVLHVDGYPPLRVALWKHILKFMEHLGHEKLRPNLSVIDGQ